MSSVDERRDTSFAATATQSTVRSAFAYRGRYLSDLRLAPVVFVGNHRAIKPLMDEWGTMQVTTM
jgi:hypothetical protein